MMVTASIRCHFERSQMVREAEHLAESRNLLVHGLEQQVPRLRSVRRRAANGTPLKMTVG